MSTIDYSLTLEVVLDLQMEVGEGPIWDRATSSLLFVESFKGMVYQYDPSSGRLVVRKVGQAIGAAIPRRNGELVLSGRDGLLALSERSPNVSTLVPIEKDRPGNRMNDAKCDSRGRLWSGTFSMTFEPKAGSIYRIDPDLQLHRMAGDVYISNGIAWNPAETLMYYVDTAKRGIDVFDYDVETGDVHNRRRFVDIDRTDGLPDGVAMDAEGCLWVALYFGGAIRRYSPDGQWIGTIKLPLAAVTSCGFGGKDLKDLYITTGTHTQKKGQQFPQLHAGALFRCRPGVSGMPVYPFGG